MPYRHLEDEALLALVALGRPDALAALYDRYARAVYSLALYLVREGGLAEEITQEVFLKVWEKARSFDPRRGKAQSWLLRIAHNTAVDTLRRRRQNSLVPGDLEAWTPSPAGEEPLAVVDLHQALSSLPEEQREVVLLAYFQGLTHTEISRRLNIPLGTVKTRLRLALQKLRSALGAPEEG